MHGVRTPDSSSVMRLLISLLLVSCGSVGKQYPRFKGNTKTNQPQVQPTPAPSGTPTPSGTPEPSDIPIPIPTSTFSPTPLPTPTATPAPTPDPNNNDDLLREIRRLHQALRNCESRYTNLNEEACLMWDEIQYWRHVCG